MVVRELVSALIGVAWLSGCVARFDVPVPGSSARALAAGDLNGDGHDDLVVGHIGPEPWNVSAFLGDGDGGFAMLPGPSLGAFPRALALADLNGDGSLDLVVCYAFADGIGTTAVYLGTGRGTFAAHPLIQIDDPESPERLAVADMDRDGHPDLLIAGGGEGPAKLWVFRGDGTGGFSSADGYRFPQRIDALATGDLNVDGFPDVVVSDGNTVYVLLNDGTGALQDPQDYFRGPGITALAVADLNSDGLGDVFVTNAAHDRLSVLYGIGYGRLAPPAELPTGDQPDALAVGDLNGDGTLDVVTANHGESTVSLFLGTPTGKILPRIDLAVGKEPTDVVLGRFTGHRQLDAATVNAERPSVSLLYYP